MREYDSEVGKMADTASMPWPQPPGRIGGAPQQQYAVAEKEACRPSLADQAEKQAAYHHEQASKHFRSAEFLRAHPEFGTFIDLLRSGALQI